MISQEQDGESRLSKAKRRRVMAHVAKAAAMFPVVMLNRPSDTTYFDQSKTYGRVRYCVWDGGAAVSCSSDKSDFVPGTLNTNPNTVQNKFIEVVGTKYQIRGEGMMAIAVRRHGNDIVVLVDPEAWLVPAEVCKGTRVISKTRMEQLGACELRSRPEDVPQVHCTKGTCDATLPIETKFGIAVLDTMPVKASAIRWASFVEAASGGMHIAHSKGHIPSSVMVTLSKAAPPTRGMANEHADGEVEPDDGWDAYMSSTLCTDEAIKRTNEYFETNRCKWPFPEIYPSTTASGTSTKTHWLAGSSMSNIGSGGSSWQTAFGSNDDAHPIFEKQVQNIANDAAMQDNGDNEKIRNSETEEARLREGDDKTMQLTTSQTQSDSSQARSIQSNQYKPTPTGATANKIRYKPTPTQAPAIESKPIATEDQLLLHEPNSPGEQIPCTDADDAEVAAFAYARVWRPPTPPKTKKRVGFVPLSSESDTGDDEKEEQVLTSKRLKSGPRRYVRHRTSDFLNVKHIVL